MTEASHQITTNPLPPAPHVPGSVGIPQGDIEIQILGVEGEEVAAGDEGEVYIRSPSVTAGYRSNPEANAAAFTGNGLFRTGDYGKLDKNGYLYLTGRIKEFINKGWEKISPVEIDHVIAGHQAIADVVSFAIGRLNVRPRCGSRGQTQGRGEHERQGVAEMGEREGNTSQSTQEGMYFPDSFLQIWGFA